jgi:transcriptional regulator with XRE-family HTH domain
MSDNKFNTLNRIRELCELKGWTLYHLAYMSGIAYSNLNNMVIRNTQPTIPTIEKLCLGFNISLEEFFSTATPSAITGNELSVTERDIIETYRNLTKNDKKLFQAYLDGLSKK